MKWIDHQKYCEFNLEKSADCQKMWALFGKKSADSQSNCDSNLAKSAEFQNSEFKLAIISWFQNNLAKELWDFSCMKNEMRHFWWFSTFSSEPTNALLV